MNSILDLIDDFGTPVGFTTCSVWNIGRVLARSSIATMSHDSGFSMNLRITQALTSGLIACALVASGATIAGATPMPRGVDSEGASATDTVQEFYFTGTPESAKGEMSTQASCTFVQRVDYAHISSTSPTRAAQSHGNWGNVNCSYTSATVTNMVQKKNTIGIFVNVGLQGKAVGLRPSSDLGSSARVTSHYDCLSTAERTFRSWTDVDVDGIADLPNRQYSPERQLKCE